MTGFKSLVLFVSFVCAAAVATPLLAQTQVHDVFKAQGANANTFLDGMSVNGVGNASAIDVFRDRSSGDTFLLIEVFDGSTVHFLGGSIPATDFAIADDLRWATLHTVINSSPGQFDDPSLGLIVDLAIDLTWSPDSFGQLVVTSRFTERIPGTTIGHWETFHQNGPRAFGPLTGSFGAFAVDWFGELNANRSIEIARDVH